MAPWRVIARGAALEAGWAAIRLAGIPVEMATGGLRSLAGRRAPDTPAARTAGPGLPVLLVHGLADRASVFTMLRRGLRDGDVGPLTAVTNGLLPDIRQAARALGEQVEQMRHETAGRPVCVIGHSLGGLIARYYVQRLGGDAHVPLVITLGTPHGGTAAAAWAPFLPLLRQLSPGSDLVRELAEPAADCRTRFVAFYSDVDEAVIPTSRARIDHPDLNARNVLIPGVGHLTLPNHAPLIRQIRAELALISGKTSEETAVGPRATGSARRGWPGRNHRAA